MDRQKKDWYKVKKYPHIGLPLKNNDRFKWIEKYVTSKENIAKHSFLPFIHKTTKVRKFRKEYDLDHGLLNKTIVNGKNNSRKSGIKDRQLYYASHLDSLIFSYYSKLLSDKYEEKIKLNGLNEVINAYRSVPIDDSKIDGPNKCNIDFANDVFKYISEYKEKDFVVIAFDIKSFFDNLDHKILRDAWMKVLTVEKLPEDHFNVFKNITRFSYVDIVDLFEKFKNQIFIQKRGKSGKYSLIKRGEISQIKFMRSQEAIAFCTKEEFLKNKNELLKNSKKILVNGILKDRTFGIPQGSPISSTLANIYLLEFDKYISDYISDRGIYRRYSDDMIIVCPKSEKSDIEKLMYEKITEYKLEIQKTKTQIFHFKRENERLQCGQEFNLSTNWNRNFIYLGFEFDGETVLIRSASLAGYYRKMKKSVIKAKKHSNRKFNKNKGEIFKRRLLMKFSYKGAQRKRKWILDKTTNQFKKSEFFDWGNFLSYAYKASNTMINNKIKKQLKNHWKKLDELIKK
ncbi:reverse transcriptase domain-containing protein [Myroides sp. WP-1]|uniref:reverse transcriptase domain-containing protein n=1 Tax=Myroides sp. WP-1 TaxID=2759944 RepID=UPI0015F9A131|nr:reverse transcriptase domain-containing protein [Myroides sp. WP-1]MBB1137995.1 RNA-dependent DNA polymerase [Myroides sp. WP-1]